MLRSAFNRLVIRHPLLRARLVRTNGEIYFDILEDVSVNVEEIHGSDWVTVFEDNMTRELGHDDQPLWFIQYLPEVKPEYTNELYKYQCTVSFTSHHSVVDGVSMRMLLNELMNELQSELKGDAKKQEITSLPIPPPIEDIFGKRSRFDLFLESVLAMVSEYLPGAFVSFVKWCQPSVFRRHSSVQALLSREQKSSDVTPTTSIVHLILSKEQTEALHSKCAKHNVTTQAALIAAYFITLDKQASIRGKDVTFFSSVDVRNHKEVIAEDIDSQYAIYRVICDFQMKMPEAGEPAWDTADKFHKVVSKDIDKKVRNGIPGNFLFAMMCKTDKDSIRDRSCMLATFHDCHTFEPVSRYPDCPVRMVGYKCGYSDHNLPGFLFNIIKMTYDGEFSAFFKYSTSVITKEFAKQMVADIKDTLIKMIE